MNSLIIKEKFSYNINLSKCKCNINCDCELVKIKEIKKYIYSICDVCSEHIYYVSLL